MGIIGTIFTLLGIFIGFLGLLCAAVYIAGKLGFIGEIEGTSMSPALKDNDWFFSLPVFRKIKRNDIICFTLSESDKNIYIKRVIALPGETVQIKNGRVYINGELFENDIEVKINSAGQAKNPIKLGDDEYFVLGDNRNKARDSRGFGPIKRTDIKQRLIVRLNKDKDRKRRKL